MSDPNALTADQTTTAGANASVDHGLLWLDGDLRVVGHNATYQQLMELDGELETFIGRPFQELLRSLQQRGEFVDGEVERYLSDHLPILRNRESFKVERVRPNGVALSISAVPLPGGGYVYVYHDVSETRRLRELQRRSAKASVIAMANLAEHRDADTGIHVLRVARLVGQTARKLMMLGKFRAVIDEEFIERAATASILHDIGKITTPDHILLKTGELSATERQTIQEHTTIGARLIRQAKLTMGDNPYLDMGAEIALTHHEWFDGGGYPHSLAGAEISLAGRICTVADVFDALTSHRPYKTPWTAQQALHRIQEKSGSQFDPAVVAAFVEVIKERETACLFPWDDAMSVGNPRIDEQHRILIDTVNQLAGVGSLHNHYAVAMIIDELLVYAAFHFDFEEKLMSSADFPHFDEHQRMHQEFVRWVEDFRDDFIAYGKKALGEPVLAFLKDWLKQHIFEEDQRYRPFVEKLAI